MKTVNTPGSISSGCFAGHVLLCHATNSVRCGVRGMKEAIKERECRQQIIGPSTPGTAADSSANSLPDRGRGLDMPVNTA
jgi:hypothetical protein